jgi:cyanophycinase
MPDLYLIGGGWDEITFKKTFGRFVEAGMKNNFCKILLILAIDDIAACEEITDDFTNMFSEFGNVEVVPFNVSDSSSLTMSVLKNIAPTCVFVGGGLTPKYQELLCKNEDFVDYILQNNLPYGGFSAGSSIASKEAIVGGWKIKDKETDIPILDEDFSEDLDYIEIRPGLGFFEHPIDVHGSQCGTITRVIHAVDQKLISKGLVIDESTMIEYRNNKTTVFGMGQVYLIQRNNEKIEVLIYKDSDIIS